jgi:hypothetical protein
VPFLGRHPFQFLHAPARAARAIGEACYSARENLVEILEQPRDCAYRVPIGKAELRLGEAAHAFFFPRI